MRDEFQRRRDHIVKALNAIKGVRCDSPGGAFYVFPDVTGLIGAKLAGQKVPDSATLARLCIEEAKVALVPGEAFGAPGYLRLSYATDMASIREGVGRLAKLFGGKR
jgi:aspartate/methionine/tyrosine aminotransferase